MNTSHLYEKDHDICYEESLVEKAFSDFERKNEILGPGKDSRSYGELFHLGHECIASSDGEAMLNALDLQNGIRTASVLRIHLLRIIYAITMFVQIHFWDFYEFGMSVMGLGRIFFFMLKCEAQQKTSRKTKESSIFSSWKGGRILRVILFLSSALTSIRHVLPRFIENNFIGVDQPSILRIRKSLPSHTTNYPESIALLMKYKDFSQTGPPKFPESYLDCDKNLREPAEEDIQRVIELRNKYEDDAYAHYHQEKQRMTEQTAKFITWCFLNPWIKFIHIYEFHCLTWSGALFDSLQESFHYLSNAIRKELTAIINSSDTSDEYDFMAKVSIILVFMENKTEHELIFHNQRFEERQNFGTQEVPQGCEKKLTVYLSDSNSTQLISDITGAGLEGKDWEKVLQNKIPKTPDLIIIPGFNTRRPFETYGFICTDESELHNQLPKCPLIHCLTSPFNLNLFSRSIYDFVSRN